MAKCRLPKRQSQPISNTTMISVVHFHSVGYWYLILKHARRCNLYPHNNICYLENLSYRYFRLEKKLKIKWNDRCICASFQWCTWLLRLHLIYSLNLFEWKGISVQFKMAICEYWFSLCVICVFLCTWNWMHAWPTERKSYLMNTGNYFIGR